jgi:hypothetical protein
MESKKLEMKDFKEFDALFMKIKMEILEKFSEPATAGGISEDIVKGF